MQEDYESESFLKRLKIYLFVFVLMVGFSHTWAVRDVVDADGISYLDVGNAYFNGGYLDAINANGYWSPLYPLIQGLSNYIFQPSLDSHSFFIHLINFMIFVLSYLAYKFFFSQILAKISEEDKTAIGLITFPKWMWITLGDFFFLWSSMNLITISKVTPDMCVSVFVYLISGLLVKFSTNKVSILDLIFFGMFLALNYFSKAAMFLIALVYIFILLLVTVRQKSNLLKPLIAVLAFILVSAPYINELSKAKGHLTFSETGKLVYSFRMDDTYNCWMEGLKGCNGLIHPSRKIFNNPNAYEFSSPIIGSYPIWFDPTYWYSGLSSDFDLSKQLKVLTKSFDKGFDLFLQMQGFLLASFFILLIYSALKLKNVFNMWYLIIPSCVTVFMYSCIDLQYRYLGAFICTAWISLFCSVRLKSTEEAKKILNSVGIVLILFLMVSSIFSRDMLVNGKISSAEMHRQVAKYLMQTGLREGDKVAVLGTDYGVYWAHLAKVRVSCEIPVEEEKNFWASSEERKNELYTKIKEYGMKYLISERAPEVALEQGWHEVPGTSYYFRALD